MGSNGFNQSLVAAAECFGWGVVFASAAVVLAFLTRYFFYEAARKKKAFQIQRRLERPWSLPLNSRQHEDVKVQIRKKFDEFLDLVYQNVTIKIRERAREANEKADAAEKDVKTYKASDNGEKKLYEEISGELRKRADEADVDAAFAESEAPIPAGRENAAVPDRLDFGCHVELIGDAIIWSQLSFDRQLATPPNNWWRALGNACNIFAIVATILSYGAFAIGVSKGTFSAATVRTSITVDDGSGNLQPAIRAGNTSAPNK